MDTLKFVKIADVKSPCRAHPTDAGIDFFVPWFKPGVKTNIMFYPDLSGGYVRLKSDVLENEVEKIIVNPGGSVLIPLGVKVLVPKGYAMIFFNKSGVAAKKSLVVGSCVIDSGYQGELILNLHNISQEWKEILPGDKIVQGILLPVNYANVEEIGSVEELYGGIVSDRGEGGFGSSGVK